MKPQVLYEKVLFGPIVGHSAILILAESHYNPEVMDKVVTTSLVQSIGHEGDFETMNTRYRQAEY
jgi:hypothetical protein